MTVNIALIEKEMRALFDNAISDFMKKIKKDLREDDIFEDDHNDEGQNELSIKLEFENEGVTIDSVFNDIYRKHQLIGAHKGDSVPYEPQEKDAKIVISAPKLIHSKRYIFKLKNTQITDDQMDTLVKKIADNQITMIRDIDFDIIELDLVE